MAIIAPDVSPEPVPSVRLPIEASPTTFGGGPGTEALGAEEQKIAAEVGNIRSFEEIRANQTAVQQATADLSAVHTRLLTDPQNGLPAYKGVNALAGQDKLTQEFQKSANEISNGLVGDQQKGVFNRVAIESYDTFNQQVKAHVGQQLEQHDANTFEDLVNNKSEESASVYGNSKALAFNNQLITDATLARAQRLGLDDNQTEKLMRAVKTNYHEAVLSQMVNDPGFMKQAKSYFSEYQGEMDVASRDRVRQLFDTVPKQQEAQAKAAQADFYKSNMRDAMLNMFDGKMTLSEAQRLFREDKLDKSDYDILESRLSKPDANIMRTFNRSDPETFNDIRQAQLTGSKSPGEIQRMIAQGAASKDISSEDGKYLMSINSEKPPTSRDQYIEAQANNIRDFGNKYFAETNFLGQPKNQDNTSAQAHALVNDFYNAVDKSKASQGEQIDEIRDRIKQTHMQARFPGLGNLDKAPDVVIDIKGKVNRLLNPDQHSGLKPKYRITPTSADSKDDE